MIIQVCGLWFLVLLPQIDFKRLNFQVKGLFYLCLEDVENWNEWTWRVHHFKHRNFKLHVMCPIPKNSNVLNVYDSLLSSILTIESPRLINFERDSPNMMFDTWSNNRLATRRALRGEGFMLRMMLGLQLFVITDISNSEQMSWIMNNIVREMYV